MNTSLKADMKEATRLTGEGRLREALALLRGAARAKGFSPTAPSPDSDAPATKFARLGTATSAMGIGARVDAKPRASRSTFPGVGSGVASPDRPSCDGFFDAAHEWRGLSGILCVGS